MHQQLKFYKQTDISKSAVQKIPSLPHRSASPSGDLPSGPEAEAVLPAPGGHPLHLRHPLHHPHHAPLLRAKDTGGIQATGKMTIFKH